MAILDKCLNEATLIIAHAKRGKEVKNGYPFRDNHQVRAKD
jgi:hypothetical protein